MKPKSSPKPPTTELNEEVNVQLFLDVIYLYNHRWLIIKRQNKLELEGLTNCERFYYLSSSQEATQFLHSNSVVKIKGNICLYKWLRALVLKLLIKS